MDELNVFVGDQLAGVLSRGDGKYSFCYLDDYKGPPVFIGWPLYEKEKHWEEFPAVFDGVLPEGVLLEQLLAKHKLDRSDKWGQLVAVGQDLTGFLCILPVGSDLHPIGKVELGRKLKGRTPIRPPEDSLPYAVSELVTFHSKRRLRMSISGVQPKVSAVFSRKQQQFEVVEQNGAYILKPSPQAFPGAAEDEALTMRLARDAGLDVPLCGCVKSNDAQGVYWIERFDRQGQGNLYRLRCEDACQVLGVPSSFKYAGNFETLARMIREYCSNPKLQLARLFHRVLFCWVTGNGDMHLKNWSLVENGPLIELSPVYDFLNTVILTEDEEESALALDDKKAGFDKALLIDYFGREICELNDRMLRKTLDQLQSVEWQLRIEESHLEKIARKQYREVVEGRMAMIRC